MSAIVATARVTVLLGATALPLKARSLMLVPGETSHLSWACNTSAKIQSVALEAGDDVLATSFKVNGIEKLASPATPLELARHPELIGLRIEHSAVLKLTITRAPADGAG